MTANQGPSLIIAPPNCVEGKSCGINKRSYFDQPAPDPVQISEKSGEKKPALCQVAGDIGIHELCNSVCRQRYATETLIQVNFIKLQTV